MNMRPVPSSAAVQTCLQAVVDDGTGIWRTPCSEKKPLRGAFELAHVLYTIISRCADLSAVSG